MKPAEMAQLHAAAFAQDRGWSAAEISDLLASPFVQAHELTFGFALSRTLAGESELLTLAVDTDHRRQGMGRALIRLWLAHAMSCHADTAFLEVAADNQPAIALYLRHGFATLATRRGYYRRDDATAVDALVMRRGLTKGQTIDFHQF